MSAQHYYYHYYPISRLKPRQTTLKTTLLNHTIEKLVVNELNEIDTDKIQSIINEYDQLCENLDEPFPHHIKKRLCTKYHGKKILPTALSSELCYISNRNSPTPSESDI